MMRSRLSKKQKLFAYYYVMTGGNAQRSALRAGYARSTAKNAVNEILNRAGVRTYLNHRFNSAVKRASRRGININYVIDNLLNIGAGIPIRRRYKKINRKDPSKSTDVIIIGPAPTDQQVKAGAVLLRFNRKLSNAKINNLKAHTELTKSKLPTYQNHRIRRPLFLDSVIRYHRNHEKKIDHGKSEQ